MFMIRMLRTLTVTLLLISIAGITHAASLYDMPSIKVMPFRNKAPISWEYNREDGLIASDYAQQALVNTQRFTPYDAENLDQILQEQSLGMTGVVDPDSAPEVGKLQGADFLVFGTVTGLSTKESHLKLAEGLAAGGSKHTVIAKVMLRFVDATTGRIVLMASGEGASSTTEVNVSLLVRIGSDEVSKIQVTNAIEKACDDAVNGKKGVVAIMEGRDKKK
jgi:uncharacterized protein involved in formation of curli polymers